MLSAHFRTLAYSLEGWARTLLGWLQDGPSSSREFRPLADAQHSPIGGLISFVSALIPVKMQIPLGVAHKLLSALSSPEEEGAQPAEPG